jgi:hypothetical protein
MTIIISFTHNEFHDNDDDDAYSHSYGDVDDDDAYSPVMVMVHTGSAVMYSESNQLYWLLLIMLNALY